MAFEWLDTAEGVTLVVDDGYVRGATSPELAMRRAGVTLAAFVSYLVGDTAPPESVMDAVAIFTGEA